MNPTPGNPPRRSTYVSKFRRRAGQVVLVLPDDQVLRRTVELPLAARENLREVVSFELDRYTPFAAEDVMFDLPEAAGDPVTVDRDLVQVRLKAVAEDEDLSRYIL